ncbi:Conserved_hypothetical protein [Hexamita inflata]|uniref:Uncharacterized protein n=1 Tax=Hexamita inflata TaxID=28002 RepID=A0AA86TX98_9EUKA|nr:Conserved hypothetical protein [Hexamita inflata]CAI9971816.1 Conserved hypothetical protein [Hexamita inflata]
MISSILIFRQLNQINIDQACTKSILLDSNQYQYCQKAVNLNSQVLNKSIQVSKTNHIFIYQQQTQNSKINVEMKHIDVFAVFGMNVETQIIVGSQINVSIKFALVSGALVCYECGLRLENSVMVFTANGSTLSALIIECTSSLSIQNSVVQYRFNSNTSSGVVNQLDSQPATFSILNSKITGCNLKTSAFNGYISSSVTAPVTLTVSNLSVCVDTQNVGTSSATLTVSGAVVAQCQNICSGTDVYTYGLCLPALQFGSLVSFKSTCVLPFEFVLDQCLCAHGYFLNLTYCVPVVKQLTNLDVQLSQNVSEIYANISRNVQALNQVLANNFTLLDNRLKQNTTVLDNKIQNNYIASQANLQRNTTYLENMLIANVSFQTTQLIKNITQVYKDIKQNYSNIEDRINANYTKVESYVQLNATALTGQINAVLKTSSDNLKRNTSSLEQQIINNNTLVNNNIQTTVQQFNIDLRASSSTLEQRLVSNYSRQDNNIKTSANNIIKRSNDNKTQANSNIDNMRTSLQGQIQTNEANANSNLDSAISSADNTNNNNRQKIIDKINSYTNTINSRISSTNNRISSKTSALYNSMNGVYLKRSDWKGSC